MPPKRHKKLTGKDKEKMLVISRLMAIRLLVDEYIYKNRPIPLIEAKKIDKEITSLKLKCQDTRSLQVVERLKILMKNIIKEQSIDKQDNSLDVMIESASANSLINTDNNSLIVSNVSEAVENDVNNNIWGNSSIDCNNEIPKTNNITHPEISAITGDVTQVDCNTLIPSNNSSLRLDRFDNDDLDKPTNKVEGADDLVILTTYFEKQPEKETTSRIQDIEKANEKQFESNKLNVPNNSSLKLNNDFDNDDFVPPTNEEKPEKQSLEESTILQKQPEQEQTYIQEIKNKAKNEKQTKANKKTSGKNKIPAKKNIKTKTEKVINNASKQKNNSGINKTKNRPREKKQLDLSWVENMKYVREVSRDEHTDLQIEDGFWSNLTLPGIWNSNDFDEI